MPKSRRQLLSRARGKISKRLGNPCRWVAGNSSVEGETHLIVKLEAYRYQDGTITDEWIASGPYQDVKRGDEFDVLDDDGVATGERYSLAEKTTEGDESWMRWLVVKV